MVCGFLSLPKGLHTASQWLNLDPSRIHSIYECRRDKSSTLTTSPKVIGGHWEGIDVMPFELLMGLASIEEGRWSCIEILTILIVLAIFPK